MSWFFPNYHLRKTWLNGPAILSIFLVSALLVVAGVWLSYPRIAVAWKRHRMLQLQEQCASYGSGTNVWVYDYDPNRLNTPPAGEQYQVIRSIGVSDLQCVFRRPPDYWRRYRQLFEPAWTTVYPPPPDTEDPGTVLFLG